jgi:tetratricopeptide (TPR) repeat protein
MACGPFAAPQVHAQPSAELPGAEGSESIDRESPLPEDREARLDALFERLAAAETGAHQRDEQEILRLFGSSGSDTADLLVRRGRDALSEENAARAIAHAGAAIDHFPDFAEAWNLRATAFYMRGRLGQALADIERTLALEPRHFGALSGLGVILEQLGREADALAAYRAALAVNPHMDQIRESAERLAQTVDGRDI